MAISPFTPLVGTLSTTDATLFTVPGSTSYRVNLLYTNSDTALHKVYLHLRNTGSATQGNALLYGVTLLAGKFIGIDLLLPAGWYMSGKAGAVSVVNYIITGWQET